MRNRRVSAWLLAGLIAAVGVVEGVVFLAQGRFVAAAVVVVLLGLVAWVSSPAAFPRSRAAGADGVVVYWRPGCIYCLRLRWSLGRLAGRARWVDIWADADAAAYVRTVNDGNETVPTVVVEGTAHTNPEVGWVRRALQRV